MFALLLLVAGALAPAANGPAQDPFATVKVRAVAGVRRSLFGLSLEQMRRPRVAWASAAPSDEWGQREDEACPAIPGLPLRREAGEPPTHELQCWLDRWEYLFILDGSSR
jgi:hypothetical protein